MAVARVGGPAAAVVLFAGGPGARRGHGRGGCALGRRATSAPITQGAPIAPARVRGGPTAKGAFRGLRSPTRGTPRGRPALIGATAYVLGLGGPLR